MVDKNKSQNIERRLITAALPYINNIPHLGHIVGSHLPADIFARYCRIKGYETLFVGGTDENGSPSEIASQELGVDLDVFAEKLYEAHAKIYKWFNISYDNFSRTSKEIHDKTVLEFFDVLNKKGLIKEGTLKVFYSPEDERFLPDRYVCGECPKCGYPEADGDQCERCLSVYDSTELKNPRSKISGGKLELRDTKHLFLSLDKLSPELKKWIDKQDLWRKQVKNLALGWIKEGLKERCITRDLKNGVPVPLKGYENKVFYVWFDAPIGYVSSTRELTDKWENYWKEEGCEIFNFLGKDNIPFHTIFWPAMLIGNGRFNLAKNVIGLQYLNYEGKKFSKSKKVGVFCERLPELGLPVDIWRSYLTQVIPEVNDTEFRWKDLMERVNSDLIGNYANYVNRVVNFIENKLGGKITKPSNDQFEDIDRELFEKIKDRASKIEELLEKAEIREAYAEVLALSSDGNKYINDTEPWVAIKESPERANLILYNAACLLKVLAVVSSSYLPETSEKVWKQLGLSGKPDDKGSWKKMLDDFGEEHEIGKHEILFKKISEDEIEILSEKAAQGTELKGFFE